MRKVFIFSFILFLITVVHAQDASEIIKKSGVTGGIIVQLGVDNPSNSSGRVGEYTTKLRINDKFIVHALEKDPKKTDSARKYISSLRLYGDVSIEQFFGKKLPYAENLVNLIVVANNSLNITGKEIERVLTPGGVAMIREAIKKGFSTTGNLQQSPSGLKGWVKLIKPVPKEIDEWTHYLHDSGNNALANDTVVGPPRRVQWIAPPLWLRSHEAPSGFLGLVIGKGRAFYIFDEGLIGIVDTRFPARWSIIARDAFNGKLLWKRELPDWGWRKWAKSKMEGQDLTQIAGLRHETGEGRNTRMVVAGDYLLMTLGYNAPLSILDAGTGNTIHTIKDTDNTTSVIAENNIAMICLKDNKEEFKAIEIKEGKIAWKKNIKFKPPLAMKNGKVFCNNKTGVICFDAKTGKQIWETSGLKGSVYAYRDYVILMGESVTALDAKKGKKLWEYKIQKKVKAISKYFYINSEAVWFGTIPVDEHGDYEKKGSTGIAIGVDLKTGKYLRTIKVENLLSDGHHSRCYRSKATERFIITGREGSEFLDLKGDAHQMNNFVRGPCKYGVTPANGLLYVPPDQCFCDPGAKFLGFSAIGPAATVPIKPIPDSQRLIKGPAYGKIQNKNSDDTGLNDSWPTFRHDSKRWGTTETRVTHKVKIIWNKKLGRNLTAPVAHGNKVFVADKHSHTVFALNRQNGEILWKFTANGRIDSPPTIYQGMVLFGSADGRIYCLKESDGKEIWRFIAAYYDRRMCYFGQLESAWPIHGSVLVIKGKVYFSAGRSTYLDSGIYLYALDPATGKLLHKGHMEGPHPDYRKGRDESFFITGANSDVLVSEGNHIYMRQKKLTFDLKEVDVPIISKKGAQDPGLHVFSTASLLDGSWFNRTFWMYAKRWPSMQLASQSSKAGQILVVDKDNTFAVKVFYRRNTHSPMFFPGKEGILVFADKNTNEPQILGDKGAKDPVKWLPQSDYNRGGEKGWQSISDKAFGHDKGMGYTRGEPPLWKTWAKVRVRAMVKAGDNLFIAGPPDEFHKQDPFASFEGKRGGIINILSAGEGKILHEIKLTSPPVFDGMIAAYNNLFISLENGQLLCLGE